MAVNEYVNRVETVNDEVLMDISEDTVTESDVLKGKTFHLANGAPAVGTRNECDCGDFDILEGNLPISFKGNGNPLYDYEIKGNNNINRVDESQSTLPVNIDAYGGNAVDWEIFGNNNPVVETKNDNLPLELTSSSGNVIDYTVYGNNNCNKNLLEITAESQTVNGVTFTVDKQAGIITVNGTATANARIEIGTIDIIATEQYNLSGNIETPSESENRISALYVYSHSDLGIDYGSGVALKSVKTDILGAKIAFMVYENKTVENAVIRPMFRLANTTSDFEPYTVGVGERTKNLLEITAESQTLKGVIFTVDKQAGTVTATGSASANQEYYLEGDLKRDIFDGRLVNGEVMSSLGLENGGRFVLSYYDADQVFISGTQQVVTESVQSVEISIPANAAYYRFYLRKLPNYENDVTFKPMLCKANASSVFVPYGYQIPLDIWHKTKNLVDLSNITDSTNNGVTYTVDSINGTITANRTETSTSTSGKNFSMTLPAGTYIFSCSDNAERDVTYDSYLRIGGSSPVTIARDNPDDPPGSEFTLTTETTFIFYIRIQRSYDAQNLVLKPMIRLANTSSDFEPYYLTNHEDIYIGNSPLTQEQSITKTSSGTDIALYQGNNTISTTLYNKPKMSLTYNSDSIGIGERTRNLFNYDSANLFANTNIAGELQWVKYDGTAAVYRMPIEPLRTYIFSIESVSGVFRLSETASDSVPATSLPVNMTSIIKAVNISSHTFTTSSTAKYLLIQLTSTVTPAAYQTAMLVEGSTTPQTYIPFGYQIPILVTSGQTTTPYNLYIGNSLLTAGQSISKSSMGTNIELLSGTNTISTTMGNKPEMRVDYESAEVGVGERTKNIINYTDIDATEYGIHCYWENDGVHVEGIFSESTPKAPQSFRRYCYLEAGTYILSGSTDYTTTGFHLQIGTCSDDTGSNFTILGYDNGSGYTLTLQDASYVGVRIYISAAATGQQIDAVMPIMLRPADNTMPDFIPYGYQVPIQSKQRTENLFNKDAPYTASKYLNSSGEEVSGATWGISEYIPIEGDTTYTAYNLSGGGASACWYDENKNFISGENYGGATSKSFSLPSNAKYIRITIRLLNPSNIDTLMLIKGSTSPENYIPYYNIIEKDIYIGDSPLIEGQSVTKELLLEDIPTYNGETIIDTTLYNKPYSIIIPTNKAANIIKEIQKLWDAVKSINPSSQPNSIDIVKKRIKLSNNVDSPVIIENISDVKVYEEDTQNSTNQESGDLI